MVWGCDLYLGGYLLGLFGGGVRFVCVKSGGLGDVWVFGFGVDYVGFSCGLWSMRLI